ncbi:MAG: VCBS repeat-containing protein [Planctomycetota bacterium]
MNRSVRSGVVVCCLMTVVLVGTGVLANDFSPANWHRHIIDDSSRGADGVRLADVDGDGRLDIVTGWEEGGVVRVCFQPDKERVRDPWPGVTVGRAPSPEDAFAVDLDQDGRMDVVSCHEGREQAVWVHWQGDSPRDWTSQIIPCTKNVTRWMYAVAMQVDGQNGVDLIVGSKHSSGNSRDGRIVWLQAPENPRDVAAWQMHHVIDAAWIMSLEPFDLDDDGKTDVVVTDRKGPKRGAYWLEYDQAGTFRRKSLPLSESEVMFADVIDTSPLSIWISSRDGVFSILEKHSGRWTKQQTQNPFGVGSGKAIAVAHSGEEFIVGHTSNTHAAGLAGKRPGVAATRARRTGDGWVFDCWSDVSGADGEKFDRAEWLDLDQDGDLDLMTCEERSNLGVVWYEQPE